MLLEEEWKKKKKWKLTISISNYITYHFSIAYYRACMIIPYSSSVTKHYFNIVQQTRVNALYLYLGTSDLPVYTNNLSYIQ